MKPPRLGREVLKRGALNINELVAPTGTTRPDWIVQLDGVFRVAA